jgi:hypothetical protein
MADHFVGFNTNLEFTLISLTNGKSVPDKLLAIWWPAIAGSRSCTLAPRNENDARVAALRG